VHRRAKGGKVRHVSAAAEELVGHRLYVWIVDDSPLEAELVRRSLAPVCAVEVFTDAAAMLEHASRSKPPDAIVLDWEMPGLSGIEVCQFLRSQPPTQAVPILMLTIHNETRDLVQGLAAGADDFLAKPYNAAELSARISALVRAKRTRERADAAERTVRALLMQLPEAVVSVDGEGVIVFVNLEAQKMLGADATALRGQRLQDLLSGLAIVRSPAHGDQTVSLPDVRRGDRVYAPVLRAYAGIDEQQTTFSFRDVTSDRRHDQERAQLLARERDARAEAEAANRAKDEFLAVVSHELRTPLNAMLGWMRLLRNGTLPADRRAQALETVERNALAQKKLVEDILDVSRVISGNLSLTFSALEIALTVRMAVEAVRPAADAKALGLHVDIAQDIPVIEGDADRFQQMVWNLLSNAVKFTPRGGSVNLDVSCDASSVAIRVSDTGEGIAPAFLPHIFERFRQGDTGTTRRHGGLGLGLAIVKHLAELHGGSIEARSDGPGNGATFVLRLPAHAKRRVHGAPVFGGLEYSLKEPSAVQLKGMRLLVVEDDEDTRELITTILKQQGAEVAGVGSAADAFVAVEREAPTVVVSDIGLPVQDGYELARTLRGHAAHLDGSMSLLAVTAFAANQDRERALQAGFDAFIAKPVDSAELIRVVAKLVAQRQAVSRS
jgi:signal transduction histidine kinase